MAGGQIWTVGWIILLIKLTIMDSSLCNPLRTVCTETLSLGSNTPCSILRIPLTSQYTQKWSRKYLHVKYYTTSCVITRDFVNIHVEGRNSSDHFPCDDFSWSTWPWVINKWAAPTFYSPSEFATVEYAGLLPRYSSSNRLRILLAIIPSFVGNLITAIASKLYF